MPSKTRVVGYGIFFSIVYGVLLHLFIGSNIYLERLIWAFLAVVANLAFAVKLRKITEVRWGIILVMGSLYLPYIFSLIVMGYIMWAYYRWEKSKLATNPMMDADSGSQIHNSNLRDLFEGVEVRYFCLWFILSNIIAFVFASNISRHWFESKDVLLHSNIEYIALFGLLLFWVLRNCEEYEVDVRQFFGSFSKNHQWSQVLILFVFTVLFGAGIRFIVLYSESFFFPSHVQELLKYNPLSSTGGSMTHLNQIFLGIIMVIIGPIMEEIIFRGIILRRLVVKWNIKKAILVSSFIFGILHGDDGGIGAFVVGITLSVIYINTKTLIIPILLHMANNALAYGSMWISLNEESATLKELQSDIWIGVMYTVICLIALLYCLRKNWPKEGADLPILTYESSYADNKTGVLHQ